jgi:hypothetical protein
VGCKGTVLVRPNKSPPVRDFVSCPPTEERRLEVRTAPCLGALSKGTATFGAETGARADAEADAEAEEGVVLAAAALKSSNRFPSAAAAAATPPLAGGMNKLSDEIVAGTLCGTAKAGGMLLVPAVVMVSLVVVLEVEGRRSAGPNKSMILVLAGLLVIEVLGTAGAAAGAGAGAGAGAEGAL